MAKKNVINPSEKHYCGECVHHTNEHCLDVKGRPFMCNCPFREGNLFMHYDWCEDIKLQ